MAVTPADVVLFGVGACAVYTDLRSRRISNRLTYPAMVAGLILHAVAGGWGGLASGALGLLIGVALLLLPCAIGAMGGGDLKFLAAIGALQGPQFVLYTAIYTGLAGGVVAVVYLLHQRGLRSTVGFLSRGRLGAPEGAATPGGAVPYGVAIAIGAILALLQTWPARL